jgi:hypothetical protein
VRRALLSKRLQVAIATGHLARQSLANTHFNARASDQRIEGGDPIDVRLWNPSLIPNGPSHSRLKTAVVLE